jgi:hypothetical protein
MNALLTCSSAARSAASLAASSSRLLACASAVPSADSNCSIRSFDERSCCLSDSTCASQPRRW